jgi:hypothetical protein
LASQFVTGTYRESFDKFNGKYIWDRVVPDDSSHIFWDSKALKWCVTGTAARGDGSKSGDVLVCSPNSAKS